MGGERRGWGHLLRPGEGLLLLGGGLWEGLRALLFLWGLSGLLEALSLPFGNDASEVVDSVTLHLAEDCLKDSRLVGCMGQGLTHSEEFCVKGL